MKIIEMTTDKDGKLHGCRYEMKDAEARKLVAKGYAMIIDNAPKRKNAQAAGSAPADNQGADNGAPADNQDADNG